MEQRLRLIRRAVLGFVAAILLLGALLSFVGIGDVLAVLRRVAPLDLVTVFGAACCWMAAWSYTLTLVLRSLGVQTAGRRGFLLYLNLLFANSVAPFSVGGGEPIGALLIARATRLPYDRALLGVVTTSVVNYLPAPLMGVFGVGYLLTTATLGRDLAVLAGSLVALAILSALLALAG